MCGIAGYVGARPRNERQVEEALACMRRRGPDHAGAVSHPAGVGRVAQLLSTRLDVIDLTDRSNQPLRVGTKTVVYNGELYNYRELRSELEREGARFTTESDTEVLVQALAWWGDDALDRCEGMWAFAVHDEADGSVTLCRDRFGEKPLWLHRAPDALTFASEPKAVFALLGRRLEPDLEQVRRFLVTGYRTLWTEDDRSFFRGLELLPPATVLRIDADGRETQHSYWEPSFRPDDAMTYEEAVTGVRERVLRSVELRLRADVPVAFCMSGGVDSTSLIAAAKRVCGYDVHGFTVVNEDARYDEREAVAGTVDALSLRHTEVPLEHASFLPRMRELVRYHDAPVSTISYYVHWRLMEGIAGDGYRVAVSGTAADELLSGYYDHHLAYLAQVRDVPELHEASVAAWQREIQPLVRNPHLGDPDLFVRDPSFRGHIVLGAEDFAGFLVNGYRPEPFRERMYSDDLLRSRMLNELRHETVPVILQEDDLNSMFWSVENRSPYLDRALAEFCSRIPTRHLVRDGRAKAPLRDAMRGIAPDHVLDEPRKVGFNAPIEALLDLDNADVCAELLADSPVFDVVRRERVAELLQERSLSNSRSKFLFSFVASKIFLEEHGA
jgi:asparagine synthase (glutamine-hydrolysing)